MAIIKAKSAKNPFKAWSFIVVCYRNNINKNLKNSKKKLKVSVRILLFFWKLFTKSAQGLTKSLLIFEKAVSRGVNCVITLFKASLIGWE